MAAPKKRIGEMLLEAGIIDETQLKAALGHQRQWGVRLGQALVDLKLATEADIVRALSLKFGFEVANLDALEPYGHEQALKLFPREFTIRNNVFPMWADTANVTVAMSDPTNLAVVDEIRFRTGRRVKVCIGGDQEIVQAVRKRYPGDGAVEAIALDLDGDAGITGEAVFDPFGGGSKDALEAFFGSGPETGTPEGAAAQAQAAPPAPVAPPPVAPRAAPARTGTVPAQAAPPQPSAAVAPRAAAAPPPVAPPPVAPRAAPARTGAVPAQAAPPGPPRPAAVPPQAAAHAPAPAPARPAPASAPAHGTPPRAPAPAAPAAPARTAPAQAAPAPAAPARTAPAQTAPAPAARPAAPVTAAPGAERRRMELELEEKTGDHGDAGDSAPSPIEEPHGEAVLATDLVPEQAERPPSRELTEQELAILESLDRLASGAPAQPEIVKPAQAMAALIRLLIRRRIVTELEFLDELSKK